MSCLKNTDVINVAVMSEKHACLNVQCFSDITATFMTPVFFRNNSNIYDISVFFSWHLHSCHQCFSDMGATVMTPVLFRHYIPQIKSISPSGKKWWQLITRPNIIGPKRNVNVICIIHSHTKYQVNKCFSEITATFMTSVFFQTWRHQCLFQTWHIHLWHQCIFHMTFTFMTSVFFRYNHWTRTKCKLDL
jgi:hypothetical protein